MAAIQSLGEVETVQRTWSPGATSRGLRLYDTFNYAYATLYRMQPNIRTCVDFLSRNIAQLGLHVFRRVTDTDRLRLTDHDLAARLSRGNGMIVLGCSRIDVAPSLTEMETVATAVRAVFAPAWLWRAKEAERREIRGEAHYIWRLYWPAETLELIHAPMKQVSWLGEQRGGVNIYQ